MKVSSVICIMLIALCLATTAHGFELRSIASLPCLLFGVGCPCPTLPTPRRPICSMPTPPLLSIYQDADIKYDNRTSLMHVCTKVPLGPLPKTQPFANTVSNSDALKLVNFRLYQTQIDLDAAKKGEKETKEQLEGSKQGHAMSLKELALATVTIAALRNQLEQSSNNIRYLEAMMSRTEAQLVVEKTKSIDMASRLDAAIDKAADEKTRVDKMTRIAQKAEMLLDIVKNEKQSVIDELSTSGSNIWVSFSCNIVLAISLAIVMLAHFVRSCSARSSSPAAAQIEPDSSAPNGGGEQLPKRDSFSLIDSADSIISDEKLEVNPGSMSTGTCDDDDEFEVKPEAHSPSTPITMPSKKVEMKEDA